MQKEQARVSKNLYAFFGALSGMKAALTPGTPGDRCGPEGHQAASGLVFGLPERMPVCFGVILLVSAPGIGHPTNLFCLIFHKSPPEGNNRFVY
jgi:hypothetical protein